MHTPASLPLARPFSRRWWTIVAAGAALVAVAHVLDPMVWESLRDARVNDRDWGRLLRSMGYLPLWMVAALALWLHGSSAPATDSSTDSSTRRRAGLLLLAPALAGLVAELTKLLLRRLRPDPEQFGYVFRAFGETPFSTRNLGLPSSHVMVAFGGAFALACLFPRTRWVWFPLAAGCALTRIMSLGHFLSDTVLAAVLAWVVVSLLRSRMLPADLPEQHATTV